MRRSIYSVFAAPLEAPRAATAQTYKPMLHGQHWIAITGKLLAATVGVKLVHEAGMRSPTAPESGCVSACSSFLPWCSSA